MNTQTLKTFESNVRDTMARIKDEKLTVVTSDDGAKVAYIVDAEKYEEDLRRSSLLEMLTPALKSASEGRLLSNEQAKERTAKWLR